MLPFTLNIGDVLIRHPWVLHRGTPNATQTPRPLATIAMFGVGMPIAAETSAQFLYLCGNLSRQNSKPSFASLSGSDALPVSRSA